MSFTLAQFREARLDDDQGAFERYLAKQRQTGKALAEGVLWESLEEAIQANRPLQVDALLPMATYPRQKPNQSRVLHALNAALGAGGRSAEPPGPHHRAWAETLFRLCPPQEVVPLYDPAIGHTVSNPVVIERSMVAHALRWRFDAWVEDVWAQGVSLDTRWRLLAAALHPTVGRPEWVDRLLAGQDPIPALDHLGQALYIRKKNRQYRYQEELAGLLARLPTRVAEAWIVGHPIARRGLPEVTSAMLCASRRQADLVSRPATSDTPSRHRV